MKKDDRSYIEKCKELSAYAANFLTQTFGNNGISLSEIINHAKYN